MSKTLTMAVEQRSETVSPPAIADVVQRCSSGRSNFRATFSVSTLTQRCTNEKKLAGFLLILTFDQAVTARVITTGTQRSDFTRRELAAHRAHRLLDCQLGNLNRADALRCLVHRRAEVRRQRLPARCRPDQGKAGGGKQPKGSQIQPRALP